MIPKVIHYCWLSNDPIPEKMQKCMESWKKFLPEYEFVKWDLDRFDISQSVWCQEALLNKKYAFACDYIRLYAVYNFGGIYMDMDIEVIKSFDPLLDKPYMFAYEDENHMGIEAGIFGATPKNDFVKKCLDYYDGKHFNEVKDILFKYTLPKVMKSVYEKGKFEYQIYDQFTFTAKSYHTGELMVKENTYSIHHFEGSWQSEADRLLHEEEKIYKKRFGVTLGRNIVAYKKAWKDRKFTGVIGITSQKLRKKIKAILK